MRSFFTALAVASPLWSGFAAAAGPDIESAPPDPSGVVEPVPSTARPAAKERLSAGDLAEIVKGDPAVQPLALRLASRERLGVGTIVASWVAGALVMVGSATFLAHHDCSPATGGCSYSSNWPLLVAGQSAVLVGNVIGWSLVPRRSQVRAVVDLWNTRHPEHPLDAE